jgi:glycosyltransferase involved in cell wall biosynthesis
VPAVRISVITYRRPVLLKRALESLRAQSCTDWSAHVLNDDPADPEPARIVGALADARIAIAEPSVHRGGTANLNYGFRPGPEPFASVLEDDNWWEPHFLTEMVRTLDDHPAAAVVTANERIWREERDGSWTRTDVTLRPERDVVWELGLAAGEKCGRAILANSAMVFRPSSVPDWRTPDSVPLDVTEHYRERLVPHPVLVHDRVLVNYGRTRASFRSRDTFTWSLHQVLLIGSVFAGIPEDRRSDLGRDLLRDARAHHRVQRTALLLAGLFVPEARSLWRLATAREKARVSVHLAAHVGDVARYRHLLRDHASEWAFLRRGWVADALGGGRPEPS